MSVYSLRLLTRQALVECYQLTPVQAGRFGTQSFRVGAVELLRRKGVPAEIRQQLGGWMPTSAALGYLPPTISVCTIQRPMHGFYKFIEHYI